MLLRINSIMPLSRIPSWPSLPPVFNSPYTLAGLENAISVTWSEASWLPLSWLRCSRPPGSTADGPEVDRPLPPHCRRPPALLPLYRALSLSQTAAPQIRQRLLVARWITSLIFRFHFIFANLVRLQRSFFAFSFRLFSFSVSKTIKSIEMDGHGSTEVEPEKNVKAKTRKRE